MIEKLHENPRLSVVMVGPNAAEALDASDAALGADWTFRSVADRVLVISRTAREALAGGDLPRSIEHTMTAESYYLEAEQARLSGDAATRDQACAMCASELIAAGHLGRLSGLLRADGDGAWHAALLNTEVAPADALIPLTLSIEGRYRLQPLNTAIERITERFGALLGHVVATEDDGRISRQPGRRTAPWDEIERWVAEHRRASTALASEVERARRLLVWHVSESVAAFLDALSADASALSEYFGGMTSEYREFSLRGPAILGQRTAAGLGESFSQPVPADPKLVVRMSRHVTSNGQPVSVRTLRETVTGQLSRPSERASR